MPRGVRRFEDLIAWQKARLLAAAVYRATAEGAFTRDFGLRDQVRCASVSVMANIAGGLERRRPADFYHYFEIAQASCAEVRSHLYVAMDVGYLDAPAFEGLSARAREVARRVHGLAESIAARRTGNWEQGTGNSG